MRVNVQWSILAWIIGLLSRNILCELCPVKQNIFIHWWNYADYLFKDFESGEKEGILPPIINRTLLSCCSTLTLNYEEFDSLKNSEDLEDILEMNATVDGIVLYLPVFNYGDEIFDEYHFIKLHKSNGIPIIMLAEDVKVEGPSLYSAVIEAKGLFFFGASLAGIAGVGIWLLEHRHYPNEFSTNFFKGSWDGFWWATVTMTTVGYGDRKPQSVLGRTFGVIWMTAGLVVVSSFTAHITTAITGRETNTFDNLVGVKVGIPLGSINYFEDAINTPTTFTEYNGISEMVSALRNKEVDKLITYNLDEDRNRFIHQHENHDDKLPAAATDESFHDLRLVTTLNIPFLTGIVVGGNLTGAEKFIKCWKRNIRRSRNQMKHYPIQRTTVTHQLESKISELFTNTVIFISLGTFGGIFLIGACWEIYVRKNMNQISSRLSINNDNSNRTVNILRRNKGIIKVQPVQPAQEVTDVETFNIPTHT